MSHPKHPKTKGELMSIINEILQETHEAAQGNCERTEECEVAILGNPEVIMAYGDSVCGIYNNKNELWKCSIEKSDAPERYTFYVYHVDDSDDFCWQEENYPDELLD